MSASRVSTKHNAMRSSSICLLESSPHPTSAQGFVELSTRASRAGKPSRTCNGPQTSSDIIDASSSQAEEYLGNIAVTAKTHTQQSQSSAAADRSTSSNGATRVDKSSKTRTAQPYSLDQARDRTRKNGSTGSKTKQEGRELDPASASIEGGWMAVYADGACRGGPAMSLLGVKCDCKRT